jgi:hypothetical protein
VSLGSFFGAYVYAMFRGPFDGLRRYDEPEETMSRPISPQEAAIVQWLLEHPGPNEPLDP